MELSKRHISIIGGGAVGTALGILAARAGWPVAAVGGRDPGRTARAAEAISPQTRPCSIVEAAGGEIVLLTVSDDAIEQVCTELAQRRAFTTGSIVAHCSGALDSSMLAAARQVCGCFVASMHPLQTFPSAGAAVAALPGTYFFCEGDEAALAVLEPLIADIGGTGVRLAAGGKAKAMYHAAAVMACNYLTTLIDAAVELMDRAGAGREKALAALEPLIRATIDNIAATGPAAALTGPIARGNFRTVRRHLDALAGAGEVDALYRAAGRATADLARRRGSIDQAAWQALIELLAPRSDE